MSTITALVDSSRRSNGKHLLSPMQAEGMFTEMKWERRRIDEFLCVHFSGQRWSLKSVPWARVGDLVLCRPTRRGVFLHVQDVNGLQPSTLASRIGPLHSHPHTSPLVGTPVNSGKPTTWREPAHQCACPGERVDRIPQTPPDASLQVRKRNRKRGTRGEAPGVGPTTIVLVLHVAQLPQRRRKGSGKSHSSLSCLISQKVRG